MISYMFLAIGVICGYVQGARILVAPMASKSHFMYVSAAAEELAIKGHEVYIIQPPYLEEPKRLMKLGFKILKFHIPDGCVTFNSQAVNDEMIDISLGFKSMLNTKALPLAIMTGCENVLEKNFMQSLRDLHFDIALVDGSPVTPCLFLIPQLLKIPYVYITVYLSWFVTRVPVLPSIVPNTGFVTSDQMTFLDRLTQSVTTVLFELDLIDVFGLSANLTTLLRKHHKDSEITWKNIISNASLFFTNRGPLLEWPAPSLPNTFYLEGLTARPAHPLSKEVSDLVDSATDGIVVVSFGSYIEKLPRSYMKIFMEAFLQRPELFFFRQVMDENEDINIPGNVKVLSWLPQNDLLGNPKTKLFITHCGNNGQYEALYHGVPMIGFPLGGDQAHNAARIVAHGYGLSANLKSFTVQELLNKIDQILSDRTFRERTEKASAILRSRPMSARQTAAYWIEHVLEFGSDHLRSHAMDMPLYQYLMLDILGFFISVVSIFFIIVYYVLHSLHISYVRSKSERKLKTL